MFKPVEHFFENKDEKINNSSAAYLFKNNVIDIYAWPRETYERSNHLSYVGKFMEMSKPQSVAPFQMSQFLNKPTAQKNDVSSFLYNNLGVLLIILLGYLAVKLSTFLFLKLSNPNHNFAKNLKLILLKMFSINQNLTFKLALLFLSLDLFLFFNFNFLRGTIKTDSVTVNTNEIIDSISQLMNNDKTIVLHYDDEFLLKNAPENSFLKKMYDKKAKQNMVYIIQQITDSINKFKDTGLDSYLLFGYELGIIYFSSILSNYADNLVVFMKSRIFYEILCSFPFRKNLDEIKKKYIQQSAEISLEHGLLFKMNYQMKLIALSNLEKNTKVFKTKEDFINEFTYASNVKFENFERIFISFYTILIIILIVFIFQKTKKRLKKLYFKMKRMFNSIRRVFYRLFDSIRRVFLKII